MSSKPNIIVKRFSCWRVALLLWRWGMSQEGRGNNSGCPQNLPSRLRSELLYVVCCISSVLCVVCVCWMKVYIKVESTGPIWSVVAFATPRPRLQPHSSFFPGLGIAIKSCLSSQFDTLCFSWCGWEGTGWLRVKQICFLIHQLLRSAHLFKKNHPCLNLWNVASPAEPSSHHFLWLLAPGSQTPLSRPTRWWGGDCGSCWFYAFKYAFITDKYVTFFSRHVQWSNHKRDGLRPKRKHF